jgi:TonB family protein
MKQLFAIVICIVALSGCGKKSVSQPPADKQGAAKARVMELYELCKASRNSEAAAYMLYTGHDKSRTGKDVMHYDVDKEDVDVTCDTIKRITQSESHKFESAEITPMQDGELVTWTVESGYPDAGAKWHFQLFFFDGAYVLARLPKYATVLRPTPEDSESTPEIKSGPVDGGIMNDKAIRLVQPPYPAIARSAKVSGEVRVSVVIDENGNVISATPVSGNPLLQGAAKQAALASKFSPTKVDGRAVKVRGVIIYRFTPQ